MKFYSEKTKKMYDTVEALEKAEKAEDNKGERINKLTKERKALYAELDELEKTYEEILSQIANIDDEIDKLRGVKRSYSSKDLFDMLFK